MSPHDKIVDLINDIQQGSMCLIIIGTVLMMCNQKDLSSRFIVGGIILLSQEFALIGVFRKGDNGNSNRDSDNTK